MSIFASKTVEKRGFLVKNFNKIKKQKQKFVAINDGCFQEMQKLSENQCLGAADWPQIGKLNGWMVSSETAAFMKLGGLGMIASELPEAFNACFGNRDEFLTVVTPLYLGDTKKKKAVLDGNIYKGAEGKSVEIKKVTTITVPFYNERDVLTDYSVSVWLGKHGNTKHIFIGNERFFDITPHESNLPAQDGCYVKNKFGVNEVERFAFFSKAVYILIKTLCLKAIPEIELPNVIIANDWHVGALAGLTKYCTVAQVQSKKMDEALARRIKDIPIVHVAHHLGYQGWDFENTTRILNSLYEDMAETIYQNAKAVQNNNPRTVNTLIVHDCYNQATGSFFLADRVVTVSKNYLNEVSKDVDFGFDFRDVLQIRKDNGTFFGIINGYDKKLISPNKVKIEQTNRYFEDTHFKFFDEHNLDAKKENKKEFIKLISKLASDEAYRKKVIPLVDTYKFEDVSDVLPVADTVPVVCATSRLAEQKGYDIAADAIINLLKKHKENTGESPIFVLGGAGGADCFALLTKLKDRAISIDAKAASRIFVFHGYKDEFAYAIQVASDFYMMPCRFEPCGLVQMEAMAKGTLPIAMSTGGLVDTIDDGVDGFRTEVFFTEKHCVYGSEKAAKRLKNNVNAYTETLEKALECFYKKPEKIAEMKKHAMARDFSWDVDGGAVYQYYELLKFGRL